MKKKRSIKRESLITCTCWIAVIIARNYEIIMFINDSMVWNDRGFLLLFFLAISIVVICYVEFFICR